MTDLSGRGVGMDVVKTNISRLGGVVDVSSEYGIGTKFTITLPITLAIISALVVRVAGRTYAIPLSSVQEALRGVSRELMRNHLKHCAASAIQKGEPEAEAMYDELVDLMYKSIR